MRFRQTFRFLCQTPSIKRPSEAMGHIGAVIGLGTAPFAFVFILKFRTCSYMVGKEPPRCFLSYSLGMSIINNLLCTIYPNLSRRRCLPLSFCPVVSTSIRLHVFIPPIVLIPLLFHSDPSRIVPVTLGIPRRPRSHRPNITQAVLRSSVAV